MTARRPTPAQLRWLRVGLTRPAGALPMFNQGVRVNPRTVEACISAEWAKWWFRNPLRPDWGVCRLTDLGRSIAEADGVQP